MALNSQYVHFQGEDVVHGKLDHNIYSEKEKNMSGIIKLFIIGLFVFNSPWVFAGSSEEGVVTGRVVRFDKHTVTLSQGDHRVIVPRKSISRHIRLRRGKKVEATVKTKDLASVKPQKSPTIKKLKSNIDD